MNGVVGRGAGIDAYTTLDKIGEGTYGVVYRAKHNRTCRVVALKKIRVESDHDGVPATALREVALLLDLQHPNVVGLHDVHYTHSQLYLIFEYCDRDLKMYMDEPERKDRPLPQEVTQSFTHQLLRALEFCHTHRILHRDLKPQNILIDHRNVLKLGDFGLARAFNVPMRVYTHEVVTLWYRPPEILLGSQLYSFGVDMWSTGCILGEMLAGKPMFPGDSEIDQLFRIFRVRGTPHRRVWQDVEDLPDYQHEFPQWPRVSLYDVFKHHPGTPPLALHLLDRLLEYDPNARFSARVALTHPYFQGVKSPPPV